MACRRATPSCRQWPAPATTSHRHTSRTAPRPQSSSGLAVRPRRHRRTLMSEHSSVSGNGLKWERTKKESADVRFNAPSRPGGRSRGAHTRPTRLRARRWRMTTSTTSTARPRAQPTARTDAQERRTQPKPSQAKPSQAKPSQAKPSQAKPSQAKPSQAKSRQAKPSQGRQQGKASPAQPSPAQPSPAQPSPAKPSRLKRRPARVGAR